jgi:hypothetical protein
MILERVMKTVYLFKGAKATHTRDSVTYMVSLDVVGGIESDGLCIQQVEPFMVIYADD